MIVEKKVIADECTSIRDQTEATPGKKNREREKKKTEKFAIKQAQRILEFNCPDKNIITV